MTECTLCPSCLTLRGVVSVVTWKKPCWKCGEVPEVSLSREEIEAVLKARPSPADPDPQRADSIKGK